MEHIHELLLSANTHSMLVIGEGLTGDPRWPHVETPDDVAAIVGDMDEVSQTRLVVNYLDGML